jgi:dTDP-4-dehydrorhamnose reductase
VAKVLVTGASGLLGANAILELADEHQVVSIYHQHAVSAPGIKCLAADLSQPSMAGRVLDQERPDWVIHCAAAADVDGCEREPEMAFRSNRDMAGLIASASQKIGARLVHISTDLVFDGVRGNYAEDDEVNPINTYGRSKLAGEEAVLVAYSEAVVVRTNIYGWNARNKFSLAEWFLNKLQTDGQAPGFTDVTSTPILVNDLVKILVKLLASSANGIFHVGGRDCLSKFDFGRKVGETFEVPDFEIRPTSVDDLGLTAPRAKNLCLQGSKIESALAITLPGVDEGLAHFRRLLEEGYVDRLKHLAGGTDGTQ